MNMSLLFLEISCVALLCSLLMLPSLAMRWRNLVVTTSRALATRQQTGEN